MGPIRSPRATTPIPARWPKTATRHRDSRRRRLSGVRPASAGVRQAYLDARGGLAYLADRLRRRGGAPLDSSVADAEARAVARTGDGLAIQLTAAQRAAAVRAPVVDRVQVAAMTEQPHGRVAGHDALRLVV